MIKTIGVLAVQGGFIEHIAMLNKLGAHCIEIRNKTDLVTNKFDGLVFPGGESTVIGKLLKELDLFDKLHEMILEGLPVFGTCAGMILLAKKIINDSHIYCGDMNIQVRRNAYGKQSGSFLTHGDFKGIGQIPMTFLRAPYIENILDSVEVLAVVDQHIVAARQNNMIVTSFHPELTYDLRVHEYFLIMIDQHIIKLKNYTT